MAVQVGEEASHRADGREGGQGGAVVIPGGGLGFPMGPSWQSGYLLA